MNNREKNKSFSITGVVLRKEDWNRFRIVISAVLFGFMSSTSIYLHRVLPQEGLILLILLSALAFVWLVVEWINRKGDYDFFNLEKKRRNIRKREGYWRGVFWLLVPVSVLTMNWWMETRNMVAALVFAIASLSLITSWVFLFRERKRSKYLWTDPKVGNITKFGLIHTVMTILLGMIAIQTGLNLIYGIFAVLLSLIIVSMLLSRVNFQKIEVIRRLPRELFAQTETEIEAVVTNKKNFISVFSIWMEEAWNPELELPEVLPSAYALRIGTGESKKLFYKITFPKRGIFKFFGFTFATRFPFSMFTYYHYLKQEQQAIIYPRLVQLPRRLNIIGNNSQHNMTQVNLLNNRDTGDFRSMREYIPGVDDVRRIHWKTTARLQKPILREFELAKENSHMIVLELSKDSERFERGIELAASMIDDAFRNSIGFILVVPTRFTVLENNPSRIDRNKCLDKLARLEGLTTDADYEKYCSNVDEHILEINKFAVPVSNVIILSVDNDDCFNNWCARNLGYFNNKIVYDVSKENLQ